MASRKRPAKSTSSMPVSGVRRPSSMPPARVSHTTIARVDEEVTSKRSVQLGEIPAAWLDRLLLTAIDLPIEDGETAVVRAIVDTVATVLRSNAVGACIPSSDGQRVYRRLPSGADARDTGVDPTRLFPSFARERIIGVGEGEAAFTFHLATDDPSSDHDQAYEVLFAHRAGHLLARGLADARAHAAAQRAKRELDALESRAIQADKLAAFGQIAAGLVHELNNPLTSIVAYSDYLIRRALGRSEPVSSSDDIDRLKRIGESANRMLRFTRDLVSYARPSSELAVPVVVHNVVDQAIAFCEHVIAGAGATIERHYADDVRTLRGMPEQLTQVFVNLLTNACQALPSEGGVIRITTRAIPKAARVAIVVTDNGHGIAPAELPHVFKPFFTTKREGGGTGLGLSIVKSIVDRHGGTIHVESSRPGGTSFTIELPIR